MLAIISLKFMPPFMLSANKSHNTIVRIFLYHEYSSTRNTKLMPYELVFGEPTRSIIILKKVKTDEEELDGNGGML